MILKYIVKKIDNNKTINEILNEQFCFSTRLDNKLIHYRQIFLNNSVVDTRSVPKIGDTISINLNYAEDNSNIIPTKVDLNILYEDKWFLILNKPAGIPVHPSRIHYENSLSNGVKFYFDSIDLHKKIRPVNRLDLNTSGIIIFAKNEYIQECLIKQMQTKAFSKEYIAIVNGFFNETIGTIDLPISRKSNSIIERCVCFENGQQAITEYEVLSNNTAHYTNSINNSLKNINYSIVKCNLITGRTHQIRVHMAYIGHPLLGDTLYNSDYASMSDNHSPLISRQALHSFRVSFTHPISKLPITIECPLPYDMQKLVSL